jgi:hypothetical protein
LSKFWRIELPTTGLPLFAAQYLFNSWNYSCLSKSWNIRVIPKVRKQHQNPEFGSTQDEIQKKPAKKYISIQRGMKLRKASILVVN